jgi:hypothetical protein
MRGHYPGNRGDRPLGSCRLDPCEPDHGAASPSARLFVCAGCRCQVVICSFCDRGQVYCAGDCAGVARRRTLHDAGRRYQSSRPGRLAHAARARRYRARRNNVTHHGSPPPPRDDLVVSISSPSTSAENELGEPIPPDPRQRPISRCHWCARRGVGFVRQGFLRRRSRRRGVTRHNRTGP